eukprot:2440867-Amphidinium_carterae.1
MARVRVSQTVCAAVAPSQPRRHHVVFGCFARCLCTCPPNTRLGLFNPVAQLEGQKRVLSIPP